jgi:hypothetical protein
MGIIDGVFQAHSVLQPKHSQRVVVLYGQPVSLSPRMQLRILLKHTESHIGMIAKKNAKSASSDPSSIYHNIEILIHTLHYEWTPRKEKKHTGKKFGPSTTRNEKRSW